MARVRGRKGRLRKNRVGGESLRGEKVEGLRGGE